jgi:hypothetical protein
VDCECRVKNSKDDAALINQQSEFRNPQSTGGAHCRHFLLTGRVAREQNISTRRENRKRRSGMKRIKGSSGQPS